MSSTTGRRHLRLLGVLLVGLLLAGCSGFRGNVVAYVGDQTVSQPQLDRAVAGVSQTLPEGQQVSAPAVINVLIHGVLADQIARAKNISVTDGQRDELLKTSNLAQLLKDPAAREVAYDVATQQLVATKLGARAYLAEVDRIPVTLNPRFGVLNGTEKTIIDGLSSSLSEPA